MAYANLQDAHPRPNLFIFFITPRNCHSPALPLPNRQGLAKVEGVVPF
jgi:hypothetical protein